MTIEEIANSWSSITVDQFIQLKNISKSDYDSIQAFNLEVLCILMDVDTDDECWGEVDITALSAIEFTFLDSQPDINFDLTINNFHSLVFKDLKTLTVGEFIDLEHLFGINYFTNLPKICSILYRKNRINDWGHIEIEPRKYDEEERVNLFYSLKASQVYGIIPLYLNYKRNFVEVFENMFIENDTEEIDIRDITPEDKLAFEEDKKNKKWAWERLIYKFCQSHNLTFDQVTELPLVFFFNQLSLVKELKLSPSSH